MAFYSVKRKPYSVPDLYFERGRGAAEIIKKIQEFRVLTNSGRPLSTPPSPARIFHRSTRERRRATKSQRRPPPRDGSGSRNGDRALALRGSIGTTTKAFV